MGKPIELQRTGDGFVDAILEEIEKTARVYDDVNQWNDAADERRSYVDRINDTIETAGAHIRKMQLMIEYGLGPEDIAEDPHPNWAELSDAMEDEAIRKAV